MMGLRKFIPLFLLECYHWFLALCGAVFYGFPSRKMVVIGVTGTNGKSTVVEMCHRIFGEAGFKAASVSSIRFKINEEEWQNTLKMTMPGRFHLQKFLRQAVDAGCRRVILEVTSEGIKQYRHKFIDFDAAVITNLTPEHIESHGSFKAYKKAKGELFQSLKNQKSKIKNPAFAIPLPRATEVHSKATAGKQNDKSKCKKISIVNLDDSNAEYFLGFGTDERYGYKIKNQKSNIKNTYQNLKIIETDNIILQPYGIKFIVQGVEFNLQLLGEFNVYNALAAICVGLSQGIDINVCREALEKMEVVPGRLEIVIREPFVVIVDYAHTPDALENVYSTIANLYKSTTNIANNISEISGKFVKISERKLICVLGAAGGGRDKWKRPELGKIAARYCDEIILTNEDPYDEDPASILEQIDTGIKQFSNLTIKQSHRILDRREAIHKALQMAGSGDTVVITGKGCEPWMMAGGGKKIPWDDRKITREEFEKLGPQN